MKMVPSFSGNPLTITNLNGGGHFGFSEAGKVSASIERSALIQTYEGERFARLG